MCVRLSFSFSVWPHWCFQTFLKSNGGKPFYCTWHVVHGILMIILLSFLLSNWKFGGTHLKTNLSHQSRMRKMYERHYYREIKIFCLIFVSIYTLSIPEFSVQQWKFYRSVKHLHPLAALMRTDAVPIWNDFFPSSSNINTCLKMYLVLLLYLY